MPTVSLLTLTLIKWVQANPNITRQVTCSIVTSLSKPPMLTAIRPNTFGKTASPLTARRKLTSSRVAVTVKHSRAATATIPLRAMARLLTLRATQATISLGLLAITPQSRLARVLIPSKTSARTTQSTSATATTQSKTAEPTR